MMLEHLDTFINSCSSLCYKTVYQTVVALLCFKELLTCKFQFVFVDVRNNCQLCESELASRGFHFTHTCRLSRLMTLDSLVMG